MIYCLCGFLHPVFNFTAKMVNKHISLKVNFVISLISQPECQFSFLNLLSMLSISYYFCYHSTLISNSSLGFLYKVALFLNKRKNYNCLSWPRVFLLSAQYKRWMLSCILSDEWQSQQNKKYVKKMSGFSKRWKNSKVNKM